MKFLKRKLTGILEHFKVIRPDQDLEVIDPELQSRYFFGIKILLYLKSYSRFDIFNVVRGVCKCMDGATMGTYLVMLRFILDKEFLPQNPTKIQKIRTGISNSSTTVTGMEIQRQGLL
jgi:hypothetical protein